LWFKADPSQFIIYFFKKKTIERLKKNNFFFLKKRIKKREKMKIQEVAQTEKLNKTKNKFSKNEKP
jgi:hypothetical protein